MNAPALLSHLPPTILRVTISGDGPWTVTLYEGAAATSRSLEPVLRVGALLLRLLRLLRHPDELGVVPHPPGRLPARAYPPPRFAGTQPPDRAPAKPPRGPRPGPFAGTLSILAGTLRGPFRRSPREHSNLNPDTWTPLRGLAWTFP